VCAITSIGRRNGAREAPASTRRRLAVPPDDLHFVAAGAGATMSAGWAATPVG